LNHAMEPGNKPTIINKDSHDVYYKPEQGEYGEGNVVKPGGRHRDPIDGVATSKYPDRVFKVPDGGRVKVLPGGEVKFLNPAYVNAAVAYKKLENAWNGLPKYEYRWLPLNKLDSSWEILFQNALKIK